MKTVWFDGRRALPRAVNLGVEMDNGVEQVRFLLPRLAEDQVDALYWQASDAASADAVLLEDGVWTITNAVTQHPGEATCYITISGGENLLWHSEPFRVRVYDMPDVEGTVLRLYPSAILTGIEAAADARAAQRAAESAAGSAQQTAAALMSHESANAAAINDLNARLTTARREISSVGAAEVYNAQNINTLQTQVAAAEAQIAALDTEIGSIITATNIEAQLISGNNYRIVLKGTTEGEHT